MTPTPQELAEAKIAALDGQIEEIQAQRREAVLELLRAVSPFSPGDWVAWKPQFKTWCRGQVREVRCWGGGELCWIVQRVLMNYRDGGRVILYEWDNLRPYVHKPKQDSKTVKKLMEAWRG